MTSPTYDACMVEAELRARAGYAQPDRHYHAERHLDDCLARLAAAPDLDKRERRLLRWALLWHDSVHEPERSDSEERSAALARDELLACGVDEDNTREVARLILLTNGHHAEESDRLGALIVSIDLAILGADPERYRDYARDVRREYAQLSDEHWRDGRSVVVRSLLERRPLYPAPEFRHLEPQARRNMEEELIRLAEG